MTEETRAGSGMGSVEIFAASVASVDDPVIGTAVDGTILTWSAGTQQLLGYSPQGTVGRHLSFLAPPDRLLELHSSLEQARRGTDVHREIALLSKSGELIDVALTLCPIRDRSGAVRGISAAIRDITESRWLARTLDSTLVVLQSALDEAREAEACCRRLVGDAAHQLRSPIASIQACAQALLAAQSPSERDGLLAALVRETSRAGQLISDLLRLARLDQGEAPVPQPCDLMALITEEADRTRTLVPHLQVVVTVDVPEPPLLDPHAVHEILANLLDNARRYARGRIEVDAAVVEGSLQIRVVDDGPGLAAGAAERAFERFVTLDRKGGCGLGLPIARDLARAHGGDLVYDCGVFVLRLPFPRASVAYS